MLSTHWKERNRRPDERELRFLDLLARQAADLIDQWRAAETVRVSQDRLRMIVDSVSDYAIMTMDTDNRIISWNRGATEILGWTEEEALGQSGEMIFTDEDRANRVPAREIKTAIANGRAPDERFHQRKDGSRFYASGVMTLVRDPDGVLMGFAKILRDMTQIQEAEKALHDRELMQKLVTAQEEERTRLARDLHDALGQELTLLRLRLDSLRRKTEDGEVVSGLQDIESIAESVDQGVDRIAWELRPLALVDLGFVPAIEKHAREWCSHSGIDCQVVKSSLRRVRMRSEVETSLYRIVQEALNNIAKHSKASKAIVVFERRDDKLALVIEDNGKGFSPGRKGVLTRGIGLSSMRERAELIGGTFEIESKPRAGTTIYVTVPADTAIPKTR